MNYCLALIVSAGCVLGLFSGDVAVVAKDPLTTAIKCEPPAGDPNGPWRCF
jgi:hypothetical protein